MRLGMKSVFATIAVSLCVGIGGVQPASADDGRSVGPLNADDRYEEYWAHHGSYLILIGRGWFNSDPEGGDPGDAIKACDDYPDGWGAEMQMDINPSANENIFEVDRVASTRGFDSPICTSWKTGNLAEGTPVRLRLCMVRGSDYTCNPKVNSRA